MTNASYPLQLEVTSPAHFARIQLLLRILFAIVMGAVGITTGWIGCVLFGTLPLFAAIAVSAHGTQHFMTTTAPRVWRVLAWFIELSAYMMLVVDRFPAGDDDDQMRFQIAYTGKPTIGSALLRLLTSIPSGFVLSVLWCVSSILWIVAAVLVLVGAPMPGWYLAYQRGVLRWQARLLVNHASLVEEYPPFALDTDEWVYTQFAAHAR